MRKEHVAEVVRLWTRHQKSPNCHEFGYAGIVRGDEIAIDINGSQIPAESIQIQWNNDQDKPPLCRFPLSAPPAVYGDNYLGMQLVKSASGDHDDIVLPDVEVIVKAA